MKKFKFTIDGKEIQATVEPQEGGMLAVTVNDNTYQVEVPDLVKQAPRPVIHHAAAPAPVFTKPIAAAPVASGAMAAPLPGTITKVLVKEGQQLNPGDTVLVMEAMKMENNITTEFGGTVKAILVQQGAQVQNGQALVELS